MAGKKETEGLKGLLPIPPNEGSRLRRIMKIKWPWKGWREKGEKEVEKIAGEITKGIHSPQG